MFVIESKDNYTNFLVRAEITDDDDAPVKRLFAEFAEVCRGAGYHWASFNALIKDLAQEDFDKDYTVFDWATDYIVDSINTE